MPVALPAPELEIILRLWQNLYQEYTLKKTHIVLSTAAVLIFILLCALFSLRVIFGQINTNVTEKEYVLGEFSHKYTGMLADGKFSGSGKLVFSDNSRYEGEFRDGRFHGKGIFFSPDGWRYAGVFAEGKMTEKGSFYGKGGDVLTQNSEGIFDYSSAENWRYTGSLNEWGQTGKSQFVFPNGAVYEGMFARGRADGQGVFQSPDGWLYEGSFQKGLFDGEGTLKEENGQTITGSWMKGVLAAIHD